jgi:hypothetical protein
VTAVAAAAGIAQSTINSGVAELKAARNEIGRRRTDREHLLNILPDFMTPNPTECQMKLNPKDQIIAAAREEANERVVAARIEFQHEGRAQVTMTISRELVARVGR